MRVETVTVAVRRVRPEAAELPLPRYMTAGAAGMDLAADLDSELELPPGGRCLVPTGIAVALPEGFEAQIRPRSGLALEKGVVILNSPGTVDADYRGEIKLVVANLGSEPVVLHRGDRLAQMVVARVARVRWEEVKVLPASQRGEGGFGST